MHRSWVFTLNNPTTLIDFEEFEDVRYAVYQHEIGESGTEHFQGYVEFTKPQRLTGVRRILDQAHWEPRRGTQQQAIDYCTKLDTRVDGPYHYGTPAYAQQGKRNDIAALKKAINEGQSLREIWEAHPLEFLRYNRGISMARAMVQPHRDFKTEVHVLVGPTGTGKTRWVNDREPNLYIKQRSNWWDSYDGSPAVLLDDFYGWIPYDECLRIGDRYKLMVQIKGGQANFTAKRLYYTSNSMPEQWWSNEKVKQRLDAFVRRVDHWHFVAQDQHYTTASYEEFLEIALQYGFGSPNPNIRRERIE